MTSSMPPYRLLHMSPRTLDETPGTSWSMMCLKLLALLGRNPTCPDFDPGVIPDVQASLRPEDRVVEFGCQGPNKMHQDQRCFPWISLCQIYLRFKVLLLCKSGLIVLNTWDTCCMNRSVEVWIQSAISSLENEDSNQKTCQLIFKKNNLQNQWKKTAVL